MADIKFVVTNAGLEHILNAEEQGLKVKITHFTLGSGYGYVPTANDIDLHGNLLYRGLPKKFKYVSPNTKLIVCNLPATVGPFEYGEIGLWLEGGILFALCAFENPIPKYSSLEDTVSSSATFNCIITLDQGASSVVLDYADNPEAVNEIETVSNWIEVQSPNDMGFSAPVQGLIVQQLEASGRETFLIRDYTNNRWNVASTYALLGSRIEMQSLGSTFLEILNNNKVVNSQLLSTAKDHYLLQINYNEFRTATAQLNGQYIRFSWVEPVTSPKSNVLSIYEPQKSIGLITSAQISGKIPWSMIEGAPELPTSGIGLIGFMPVKKIPNDYLYANGTTVSRSVYWKLFAVIGTTFGAGDGATTFRLPDLRGYFPRFLDDGRGVDSEPRRAVASVQSDAIRNIYGNFPATNRDGLGGSIGGAFQHIGNWSTNYKSGGGDAWGVKIKFDASSVVPTAPEVRVKNMAFMPVIKYQ